MRWCEEGVCAGSVVYELCIDVSNNNLRVWFCGWCTWVCVPIALPYAGGVDG